MRGFHDTIDPRELVPRAWHCICFIAFSKYSAAPVILVSAVREFTGSRFEFYEEKEGKGFKGPDATMDKPVKPRELLEKIQVLLGR